MFNQIGTWTPTDILMPEQEPGDARQDAVAWAPNLTIVKGQAIGIITATKLAASYSNANVDGTQTCVGLAMYSFRTDASGRVFYSDSIVMSEANPAHLTSPIWKRGIFDPTKLTGFDAPAQVEMFARVLHNGFLQVG